MLLTGIFIILWSIFKRLKDTFYVLLSVCTNSISGKSEHNEQKRSD